MLIFHTLGWRKPCLRFSVKALFLTTHSMKLLLQKKTTLMAICSYSLDKKKYKMGSSSKEKNLFTGGGGGGGQIVLFRH